MHCANRSSFDLAHRLFAHALAAGLLCGLGACGHGGSSTSAHSSSHFISIEKGSDSWAQKIEYRTDSSTHPSLTLDGVRFELLDTSAFALNWDAIGMGGITTIGSMNYESTQKIEGEFFTVLEKEVEIVEGELVWGSENLGAVESGAVFNVDAQGIHRQP